MTTKSDSQLFFELVKRTGELLQVFHEIETGVFGEDDRLEEIQQIVDVPMVEGILLNALDEIDASLRRASVLAEKHGLEKLRDRIKSIEKIREDSSNAEQFFDL